MRPKPLRVTIVFDNLRLPAGSSEDLCARVADEIVSQEMGHTIIPPIKSIRATPGAPGRSDYWRVLVRIRPPV